MEGLYTKYGYMPDKEEIGHQVALIASNLEKLVSDSVLKECFSMMDLTTLHTTDSVESVKKLVGKVNSFKADFPDYPLPASICVYPNFASVVRSTLSSPEVHDGEARFEHLVRYYLFQRGSDELQLTVDGFFVGLVAVLGK